MPSDVMEAMRAVLGPSKVGRVSGCADGSAVVDVTPDVAARLAAAAPLAGAVQRFSLPAELPALAPRRKPPGRE